MKTEIKIASIVLIVVFLMIEILLFLVSLTNDTVNFFKQSEGALLYMRYLIILFTIVFFIGYALEKIFPKLKD